MSRNNRYDRPGNFDSLEQSRNDRGIGGRIDRHTYQMLAEATTARVIPVDTIGREALHAARAGETLQNVNVDDFFEGLTTRRASERASVFSSLYGSSDTYLKEPKARPTEVRRLAFESRKVPLPDVDEFGELEEYYHSGPVSMADILLSRFTEMDGASAVSYSQIFRMMLDGINLTVRMSRTHLIRAIQRTIQTSRDISSVLMTTQHCTSGSHDEPMIAIIPIVGRAPDDEVYVEPFYEDRILDGEVLGAIRCCDKKGDEVGRGFALRPGGRPSHALDFFEGWGNGRSMDIARCIQQLQALVNDYAHLLRSLSPEMRSSAVSPYINNVGSFRTNYLLISRDGHDVHVLK